MYPGIRGHCLLQRLLEQCPSCHQMEGTPGKLPQGVGGVEETPGIRNESPVPLACPQAGQLSPGTAYQVWRNVKWQNHSPGELHRLRHLPALQGSCEPSGERARQGLQSTSPSRTLCCLGRQGQPSAMMGCPVLTLCSGLTCPGRAWPAHSPRRHLVAGTHLHGRTG